VGAGGPEHRVWEQYPPLTPMAKIAALRNDLESRMTVPRTLACILMTVVVSLVLLFAREGSWFGSGKRQPSGPDEVARLRAELEELKQSVKISEKFARVAVQSVATSRAAPIDSKPEQGSKESEAARGAPPRRIGPDENEIAKRLEQRFSDEKPDPSWSPASQRLITEHVRKGIPTESQVRSIECRRTVCRVESQHPSMEVYKKFVDDALLFPQGGWDGPVMTSILSRSPEVRALGYLFRPGEDLEPMLTEVTPM
jgi:hypothetical protein